MTTVNQTDENEGDDKACDYDDNNNDNETMMNRIDDDEYDDDGFNLMQQAVDGSKGLIGMLLLTWVVL